MAEVTTSHEISETDSLAQRALQERGAIPRHVAIIMDGNGRWARQRGKSRIVGHHEGVESVRDVTEACAQLGVHFLTLYTFSMENWQRPPAEVSALMRLLIHTIEGERETLARNDIRLQVIGDVARLPQDCLEELQHTMDATSNNRRMVLNMALSYSGRWELVRAAQDIARSVQAGEMDASEIDESVFERYLSTRGMPDPDLLIRTGGEFRISNFLLWQLAYTEIFITDEFWPGFRRSNLYEAIRNFQDRERRFGRVT